MNINLTVDEYDSSIMTDKGSHKTAGHDGTKHPKCSVSCCCQYIP